MIPLLFGCAINSNKYLEGELQKIEMCRNKWTYKNLTQSIEMNVLLFKAKYHYDVHSFPNFIIGVVSSDTIAIIDKDFTGTIKQNEIVEVIPAKWTDLEKELIKPVYSIYKKSNDNDLQCAVNTVYYGQIKK